ncbi:MAG TPA: phosphopantetheine-binding protein [Gemmatimonadaceae bacterium]|nr:phosphopantetheine-binding protein [Gemmatimonadaceae bacterium]
MSTLDATVMRLLSRSAMINETVVRPDAELEALGMGSLEQIECVMALEDELQIELPVADLRNLRTVQDVIDAVRQAKQAATSG